MAYVSPSHRLFFTYHFSNWSMCHSHVVNIKISHLQCILHVLCHSEQTYATPVVNTSLGRCMFFHGTHFRAVGCNARDMPMHSPVAYHTANTSRGRRKRRPWLLTPLARCLAQFSIYTKQTGATPMASQSTRPLHQLVLLLSHPDSSNARALYPTRSFACQLLLICATTFISSN